MYRHLVCHIRRHESVAPHGESGLTFIITTEIKDEIGNIATTTSLCVNVVSLFLSRMQRTTRM